MTSARWATLALTATLIATAPMEASSQERLIGQFRDWTAYVHEDAGSKVCYIVSEPVEATGDYVRRGDTYLIVSHRPAGRVFGEVMVVAGYTYRDGSTPQARVDNRSFGFEIEGDAAWVKLDEQDGLVQSMRRGRNLVLTGVSSRGTETTDTYSLMGVTAGLDAIDKECGR